MAAIKFTDRDECDAALADVRNDSTDTNWCLFGYAPQCKSNDTLQKIGSGSDGVDGLVSALSEDNVYYGLVRMIDFIDGHSTVKFVQVTYVGSRARMMLKARMGTQKMSVNTFMGQHHVEVTTSDVDELSQDALARLIGSASGSNSAVLSDGTTSRKGLGRVAPVSGVVSRSSAGGGALEVDQPACDAAVQRVRSDDDAADWALLSYTDGNQLGVLGCGGGGLDALKLLLSEDQVSHAILRTYDVYDGHTTTKFVYIEFVGEHVPTIRKAVTATHKGDVAKVIGQHHVSITVSRASDLSMDEIMTKVQAASGSAVHVLSAEEAATRPQFASVQEKTRHTGPSSPYASVASAKDSSSSPAASTPTWSSSSSSSSASSSAGRTSSVGVPKVSAANVHFPDEEGMQAAIAEVRNDASDTDYCVLGYDGRTANIVLKSKGSGGVEALREQLDETQALYGLVRLHDSVDGHTTVKFVFVRWIGARVPIMQRAKLGTHQGQVNSFFGQYHVDITTSDLSEVTTDELMRRIQKASGTANYILIK